MIFCNSVLISFIFGWKLLSLNIENKINLYDNKESDFKIWLWSYTYQMQSLDQKIITIVEISINQARKIMS